MSTLVRNLWRAGLSDYDIAAFMNLTTESVREFTTKLKLELKIHRKAGNYISDIEPFKVSVLKDGY